MITKDEILGFLKKQKPIFIKKYHISKIGLFGSYARGIYDESSDIDIIIEFDNDDVDVRRIKEDIRSIIQNHFNKNVDIATEKYLFPFFKERILNNTIYA